MKDYKLSEIKSICESRTKCRGCECAELCEVIRLGGTVPNKWKVKKGGK